MRIVVQEWERVLLYRDGRFAEQLGPGRHRRSAWRRTAVRVSVRPWLLTVQGQEVLTSDGLAVRVSLAATVAVDDARTWHEAVDRPNDFLYSALQLALRDAVAARTVDGVVGERREIGAAVEAAVAGTAAAVGLRVDGVAVRDVMVPFELRRAAADLASAKAAGQAALERARSEVAATRALSNAARMVAEHPGLLQLRTLQAVESGRATVVLSHDPTGTAQALAPHA